MTPRNDATPAARQRDEGQGNYDNAKPTPQSPWDHESAAEPVRVWLQPSLKRALDRLAQADGRALSAYVRHHLMRLALEGGRS